MSSDAPSRRAFLRGGAVTAVAVVAGRGATVASAGVLDAPDAGPGAAAKWGLDERTAYGAWPRRPVIALLGRTPVVAVPEQRAVALVDRAKRTVGMPVKLHGTPLDIVAVDARTVAVACGFWDGPGVAFVDMVSSRLDETLATGDAPRGLAVDHARHSLLVCGGEQHGEVSHVDLTRRHVTSSVAVGRVPRVVAYGAGERSAWVTLQGEDALVQVDPVAHKVLRHLALGFTPDALAITADGRHAAVADAGARGRSVHLIDLKSGRSIRKTDLKSYAAALRFTASGAIVASLPRSHTLAVIGATGHVRKRRTAPGPFGVAIDGSHVWVAGMQFGDIEKVKL